MYRICTYSYILLCVGTYLVGFTVAERHKQKPTLLDISYYDLRVLYAEQTIKIIFPTVSAGASVPTDEGIEEKTFRK